MQEYKVVLELFICLFYYYLLQKLTLFNCENHIDAKEINLIIINNHDAKHFHSDALLAIFGPHTSFGDICKQCRPSSYVANAASDQGLHCLLTRTFMQNTIKVKILTRKKTPKFTNDRHGQVH